MVRALVMLFFALGLSACATSAASPPPDVESAPTPWHPQFKATFIEGCYRTILEPNEARYLEAAKANGIDNPRPFPASVKAAIREDCACQADHVEARFSQAELGSEETGLNPEVGAYVRELMGGQICNHIMTEMQRLSAEHEPTAPE